MTPFDISEKRSASIRKQHADTVATLQTTNAELERAERAVADDEVNAIVTGKSKNSALRTAVASLRDKAADLEAALTPLSAAISIVQAQENDTEGQARAARAAKLKADYRAAVKILADAVQAAAKAQNAADAIHSQFALLENGNVYVHRVGARFDLGSVEGNAAFSHQVCLGGFADLLPSDDLGRRRFEHGQAHDKAQREQWERDHVLARRLSGELIDEPAGAVGMVPDGGRPRNYIGGSAA